MNGKRAVLAIFVVWLACTGTSGAEEVEVVADSALVKVGDEVIASVEKGKRFEALRREGPWVEIGRAHV